MRSLQCLALIILGCGGPRTEPATVPNEALSRAPSLEAWTTILEFDAEGHELAIQSGLPARFLPTPEARASRFASEFCGGTDLYNLVLSLGEDADISGYVEPERAGLACGSLVARSVPEGGRYNVIAMDRRDPGSLVSALATQSIDLATIQAAIPESRASRQGDRAILCVPADPAASTCGANENDRALALAGRYLLSGRYRGIAAFFAWSASERVLSLLDDIATSIDATQVELSFIPEDTEWMIGPEQWLPYTIDRSSDPFATEVRTHARAVAWQHGPTHSAIVIAPRCADEACTERSQIDAALRAYYGAWRQTARARMHEVLDGAREPATECVREREESRVRALEGATIDSAQLVSIHFETDDVVCESRWSALDAVAAQRIREAFGPL